MIVGQARRLPLQKIGNRERLPYNFIWQRRMNKQGTLRHSIRSI
jgi:hypothetical protein